jgi:hypothetical protein
MSSDNSDPRNKKDTKISPAEVKASEIGDIEEIDERAFNLFPRGRGCPGTCAPAYRPRTRWPVE